MGCKFLGNRSVRLQNLLFSLHIYTLAAASWKLAHCCAIFLWCLGGEIYIDYQTTEYRATQLV